MHVVFSIGNSGSKDISNGAYSFFNNKQLQIYFTLAFLVFLEPKILTQNLIYHLLLITFPQDKAFRIL